MELARQSAGAGLTEAEPDECFVDIGVDLFVMATSLSYADHLLGENPADQTPQELADLFCREARKRIEANFRAVKSNNNRSYRKITGLLMEDKLAWLADGSMDPIPPQYRDWMKNDYEHPAQTADARQEARERDTAAA